MCGGRDEDDDGSGCDVGGADSYVSWWTVVVVVVMLVGGLW